MEIVTVKSKHFGEYKAFKNEESKSAFKNKLTEAYLVKLLKSDVVVDVGAYIGEYSMYAASEGVKKIFSYEPTPSTFKVLTDNCKKFPTIIETINAAIVGDKSKTVQLSYTEGSVGVTNSIIKRAGKSSIVTVAAINYTQAVKNATVVKIDCEGAEYQFDIIQPKLRAIIIEFHPIVGEDWQANARSIMSKIKKAGFKPLAEPKFENGWDMHAAYIKK